MTTIELGRINENDTKQITELINNKKIWDNLRDNIPFPYSNSDAEDFVKITKKENPHQTFGIFLNNELCGIIGLEIQKDVHKLSAELGYWLGEKYWNKGIITKSINLITEYGFFKLKLERIYARVFEYNGASIKVLQKNGFIEEGFFRNSVLKNGNICNEHQYSKLKKDSSLHRN